jgi:hypothetical protein
MVHTLRLLKCLSDHDLRLLIVDPWLFCALQICGELLDGAGRARDQISAGCLPCSELSAGKARRRTLIFSHNNTCV